MKIIELLNKIANGEKMPKKIKYEGRDMFWCEPCEIYEVAEVEQNELCGTDLYNILDNLNDKVEIIEDEKIEKIKKVVCDSDLIDRNHFVIEYLSELKYKINEIIDKINNMEVK